VVELIGKLPPTVIAVGGVPALPKELFSVCTPPPVETVVTVNVFAPDVIVKLVGMVTVIACPPSPLTEKAAEVGEGEASANEPVPVTDRTPAAVSETDPVPDEGLTILPNAMSAVLVMVMARKTLAVALALPLPEPPTPPPFRVIPTV
jgi:hypothetical protein